MISYVTKMVHPSADGHRLSILTGLQRATINFVDATNEVTTKFTVIGCLHHRTNIEQLARRSMVISMLIRKADGL